MTTCSRWSTTRCRCSAAGSSTSPRRGGAQPGALRHLRRGYVPQYQIWTGGKTSKYIRVEFPLPDDYVDETAIQVVRTAFEIYKRDDLVSDLVAHFRSQAEAASNPGDAAYPRLCASYVLLWNGDKDEAIAEFTRVAETSRTESGLRLELAELSSSRATATRRWPRPTPSSRSITPP